MPGESRLCRLAPKAEDDLEEIWLYTYRSWSVDQADRYVAEIIAAVEDLAAGRAKGRPAEVRQGYFRHPVGAHVVFYRE